MGEPFLGQIAPFAFNYAPKGWALCDGQLLPINQYQALFSLLSTRYGGNGQTTFALPDLRGRLPLGQGQGPSLTDRSIGERGGSETVTLTTTELPSHSHTPSAAPTSTASDPSGKAYAGGGAYGAANAVAMDAAALDPAGGGQPHENMPPTLTVCWCIALDGIFPSQT